MVLKQQIVFKYILNGTIVLKMMRPPKKYKKNPLDLSAIEKIADGLKLELQERQKLHSKLEELELNFSVEETFGKSGVTYEQTETKLLNLLKAVRKIKALHDDIEAAAMIASEIAEVLAVPQSRYHLPPERQTRDNFWKWLAGAQEIEGLITEALNRKKPSQLHGAVNAMTMSRPDLVQKHLIPLWKELTGKPAGVSRKGGSAYLTQSSEFIASCITALGLRAVGAEGIASQMKKPRATKRFRSVVKDNSI